MLRFIPILFLALPLVEIALFIVVGRAIGVVTTLGLVVLAVVLGVLLLRQQGLSVLNRMRSNMQTGTLPGQTLFDGMVLAIAAVLLIIPGFFGDIVALTLLIPPVRHWLYRAMTRNMTVVQTTTTYRSADPGEQHHLNRPQTIDLDEDDWQRK
ncbi:hypothetical protein VW35_10025 [Devosia soli]|uniref:Exclusion suppressor FxsA n=1 Tax=Devosia soli TaxID=361041 RepID=A0A0F5L9S9_9HYPH|nr:FxsA family protein [Devosia soli]KKB78964.1 hypothetical protein VW35_10025 [Devosia soli]